MNKTEKINKSRYTLKEILSDEWDTSVIPDYTDDEIERIYLNSDNSFLAQFGLGFNCNIILNHNTITNYRLLILYYNFKEIDKASQKVNDKIRDKIIKEIYDENYINNNDSIMIIVDEKITESMENYISVLNIELQNNLSQNGLTKEISDELISLNMELNNDISLRHFKNAYILNIDSLTNNLLKHSLIPEHKVIRDKKSIDEILNKCNANINQLPMILKTDIISKLKRITTGDICEITRSSLKCGKYPFYRVCK
jgi:DNA-directed RNA polymerase subunit H (RpoH/RPB5)